jgi:hypothetical protein
MDLRGKTQGTLPQAEGPQDRDKSAGPAAVFGGGAQGRRGRSPASGECAPANRSRRVQRSRPIQGSTGLPAYCGVFRASQAVSSPCRSLRPKPSGPSCESWPRSAADSRYYFAGLAGLGTSGRLSVFCAAAINHFTPCGDPSQDSLTIHTAFLSPARSAIHAAKAASFCSALHEPCCSSPRPAIIRFVSVGDLRSADDAVM